MCFHIRQFWTIPILLHPSAGLANFSLFLPSVPSSVLGNSEFSGGQLPDISIREPGVCSSVPVSSKASKHKNRSDQHKAFSAILGDSNPRHFLSCAQARRCIKKGSRAFLVLVSKADIEASVAFC